ncbi:MAG: efflux RND transporter periplasmic adaptor subunit [Myxococcota bacterium]|nr:efflux RND transporter periplasmic adaptor subunit [Myxococcota bacterium]
MKTRAMAALLGLLLAAGFACGRTAETNPAPTSNEAAPADVRVVPVHTHRVVSGRVPARISASGSVRARRVTAIGAEVPGRLVEVFVEVGDEVEEGAPLFRIDAVPYELALAEARAGLALARAEKDNALQEASRVGKLVEQDAVSEQRNDRLRTQAAVARARVAQMEARVARAERDLARTTVAAPYPGSVVERLAHEGAMSGPEPIVVVQESGALEAVLDIPEAALVAVRAGDRVALFAEGRAAPLETRVSRVSDRIDADTRTYEIRCPIETTGGALKAGSYVRAEVHTEAGEPRAVIHRSALVARDGRTFVFRVIEGRVEQVPVRVGVVGTERAEILLGVAAGDEIVLGESASRIADGDRVKATPRVETAAAERAP